MVEFMSGYQPPMDRQFDEEPIAGMEPKRNIEGPIIPISELGTTSFDGLQGGILRDVDQKIKIGTKKIQLVIGGNPQGMSSLAASHGKEVRQELREKALATGVEITGVELAPQKISNLSGMGRGGFSEETRHEQLGHVKDAIRFAADVGGGGGVDIFSQEFQRNVLDAKWNKDRLFFEGTPDELKSDEQWRKEGKDPQEYRPRTVKYLIDKRTGQVMQNSQVMTGDKVYRVQYSTAADLGLAGKKDPVTGKALKPTDYCDIEGNLISDPYNDNRAIPKFDEKTGTYAVKPIEWNEIEKEARNSNGGKGKPVEEYLYEQQIDAQIRNMKGQALYYGQPVQEAQEQLRELQKEREQLMRMSAEKLREIETQRIMSDRDFATRPPEEQERIFKAIENAPKEVLQRRFLGQLDDGIEKTKRQLSHLSGHLQQATVYAERVQELEDTKKRIATPEEYGREKTFDSYSEAGIAAMEETKRLQEEAKRTGRKVKDVYVGPELGWAGQMYGGHPQEFIEIVTKSRDRMAQKLKDQGYNEEAAKEAAKKHIKGMLDTSHLSMWYKHFAPKPNESEDARLKRFNGWMKEQVQEMVKKGVVGGVQVVDSITGDHSHLPAGQGIFDMVGLVKEMKRAGFNGPIVSEGHEEDAINPGRTLTATWEAFGSPIQSAYAGQPAGLRTWGGVQSSYFGHAQRGPSYVVGGYAPGNDWRPWSETPFE